MRLVSAALSALALAAHADIIGFAVPATIRPGHGFAAVVRSQDYIQAVYDVAVAFGYAPGRGHPGALGDVVDSVYLGPPRSNRPRDFNISLAIPPSAPLGPAVVSASLLSLYGVSHTPVLAAYNVSVTLSHHKSDRYVTSRP